MTAPALIGLDWGTTSLRAYLIGAGGAVLERRDAAAGILEVEDGDFQAVLERETGHWRAAAPDLALLASGMITSRQGWVEVPYLDCPAGAAELAGALQRHVLPDGAILHFVPGLKIEGEDGVPDVIRGEETQIAGLAMALEGRVLTVLPGTHSKWALIEAGRIVWFQTFMTGEVYAVLRKHSILGRLMTSEADDGRAFGRGLAAAGEAGRGLLRRLFSARTLGLFDRIPQDGLAAYLSGLLIGTEIAEALALAPPESGSDILVIGTSTLTDRYLEALRHAGRTAGRAPPDAAARGHAAIARAAGLIA